MAKRPRTRRPKGHAGTAAAPKPERDTAASCPNCTGPVSLLDAFCPACGTLLDDEE